MGVLDKEDLDLLDKRIMPEKIVYFGPGQYIRAASKQETSAIIRKINDNRAPSKDTINAEVAKKLVQDCVGQDTFSDEKVVWEEELTPKESNNATTCQIYENGSKMVFHS